MTDRFKCQIPERCLFNIVHDCWFVNSLLVTLPVHAAMQGSLCMHVLSLPGKNVCIADCWLAVSFVGWLMGQSGQVERLCDS